MAQRHSAAVAQSTPPRPPALKRRLRLAALVVAVFAVVVIVRLPASWVLPALGHELRCTRVAGSLWNGYCGGATVSGTSLGALTWRVRPGGLLRGRLAAHVTAVRANASASADVALGFGGTLVARNLRIDLPLDPSILPALPRQISGKAMVDLSLLEINGAGAVQRIRGRLQVRHLIDSTGQVTPLGSFVVIFPGGAGEPIGHVHDLGGPLALEGTVRLTAQPGYQLRARVAARSDAAPSLVNALRYLGSPDAQGRRPFALSGTY